MAQIFSQVFGNSLDFQEGPRALTGHSRVLESPGLPPPPALLSDRENSQADQKSLQLKYTWWVGDTSPKLPGPRAKSVGCAPGQQHLWGEGGSPNKAAFNWPGREWQESRSGECSQLDRKNWFRMASPAKQRRRQLVLIPVPFPKPAAARVGVYHPSDRPLD